MRKVGVRRIVGLGVVWGFLMLAIPAVASTCSYALDCTVPDSTACDGPNSTVKTTSVPGVGTLELRYDSGCRTVWARSPNSFAVTNLWAERSTAYSCAFGTTSGNPWFGSGSVSYSQQLHDRNCLGRARLTHYSTGTYSTAYY